MTFKAELWAGVWLLASSWGPCDEAPPAPSPVTTDSKTTSAAAPSAPALPKQQTPTAKAYMREHFAEADVMRRAVVSGNLAALHGAAAGLAGDEWTPHLRADWKPHVGRVRSAAQAATTASTLEAGATALGELGAACAACHQSVGGPAKPSAPPSPPAAMDKSMAAHAVATEQLWTGLAFPSDASWENGARGLIAAPALDSDVPDVAATARHLRGLAERAATAKPEQRPGLYAQVLTTCSSCHQRLKVEL